ncbi:MAG: hypothetical protein JNK49_14250 [Planctomycetes bacterium]|nr:hypothetical protein [Planctomycetota bacterium]
MLVPRLALLALAAFAAAAPAQGLRLVDRIEAPLLYLALDAAALHASAANPGAPASGTNPTSSAPNRSQPGDRSTVQTLLADPALARLLGSSAPNSSTGRALALVRGLLARSPGEIEIALTSVLPANGQPLLVCRVHLQSAEAERLQGLLAGPDLAHPHRSLGGRATWTLRSAEGLRPSGPGEQVELALLGSDLLLANDGTAMEELLVPPEPRTSATPRLVLANDPRFLSLRKRLDVPAGSLLVYGDWLRLGQRLQAKTEGIAGAALEWSGLGSAKSVMASISGLGGAFTGTLLLDFDQRERARPEPPRPGREGREGRPFEPRDGMRPHGAEATPIDGWFAAAQPAAARTLLPDLPVGGFGGLVLAVDFADVARHSHRGRELRFELHEAFDRFGLDFERNVIARLGARGTVQLLFRNSEDGVLPEVVAVYAVRAKGKKAAADLFADLRRASEQRGNGRMASGRDKRGIDVLELRSRDRDAPTCIAVHEDQVLFAYDADSLAVVADEWRRAGRSRQKRDATVAAAVASIGGEQVAGLFDVDLGAWLERAFGGGAAERGTERPDFSRIPKRHVGYLDLQPRDGGVVLRVCVLSSS